MVRRVAIEEKIFLTHFNPPPYRVLLRIFTNEEQFVREVRLASIKTTH
jgi:hypothetical protein